MILWWLLLFIPLCWASCPTDRTCEKAMNKCYKFVDEERDFFAAEEKCLELGGHLVSFSNVFEKALVQDAAESMFLGANDYWIGANHIEADTWTWTDGSKWSYTNWFPGEPKNLGTVGTVSATVGSGLWSSAPQDSPKQFVCGLPLTSQTVSVPPTCPVCTTTACPVCATTTACPKVAPPTAAPRKPFCEDGWIHFGATKSCYKIIREQTWSGAQSICESLGAHLASIHSKAENDFIADFATTGLSVDWPGLTWIGFHRISGIWQWSDSTPIDYINWGAGKPDNYDHDEFCGQLNTDVLSAYSDFADYYWQWNDLACNTVMRASVCKKPEM